MVAVLVERLANRVEFLDLNVGTTPPFKILFNDIHRLVQMNWFQIMRVDKLVVKMAAST